MSSCRFSAAFIVSAGLCALSVTLAAAQTAEDALICSEPDQSEPALIKWFGTMGWDRNNNLAAARDFWAARMFVGNLDANLPEQWDATRTWARDLASKILPDGTLFQLSDTSVEIGMAYGRRYCMVVSSRPMLDELISMIGPATVAKQGEIRRLHYEESGLRISAHEFSAFALDEWDLLENHRFVATFVAPSSEVIP
jgi:hypothetical protein